MSTQPNNDSAIDQILNDLVIPWDTSDLPPNVRVTSPSLKIAQAKAAIHQEIVKAEVRAHTRGAINVAETLAVSGTISKKIKLQIIDTALEWEKQELKQELGYE